MRDWTKRKHKDICHHGLFLLDRGWCPTHDLRTMEESKSQQWFNTNFRFMLLYQKCSHKTPCWEVIFVILVKHVKSMSYMLYKSSMYIVSWHLKKQKLYICTTVALYAKPCKTRCCAKYTKQFWNYQFFSVSQGFSFWMLNSCIFTTIFYQIWDNFWMEMTLIANKCYIFVIYYGSWLNRILRPEQKCANYEELSHFNTETLQFLFWQNKENLLETGRDEASESFNGCSSPFRLSDNFYDKAGREKRFGRICNYYSGFVSVVFTFWTHHCFVVFASATQPKQNWWRGAVGNVLLI